MNIASANPKFPSSILLQWRISQSTVARHSISTTMATHTPTHSCQPKGRTIAFHCIATVSGFLMITCVLASIKMQVIYWHSQTNVSVEKTNYQVWLSHWNIWGVWLPVFQFGGFASMVFIGNWCWLIRDPNIEHAEIMDTRYRVIHESRIEHVQFIGNIYRVIQEEILKSLCIISNTSFSTASHCPILIHPVLVQ